MLRPNITSNLDNAVEQIVVGVNAILDSYVAHRNQRWELFNAIETTKLNTKTLDATAERKVKLIQQQLLTLDDLRTSKDCLAYIIKLYNMERNEHELYKKGWSMNYPMLANVARAARSYVLAVVTENKLITSFDNLIANKDALTIDAQGKTVASYYEDYFLHMIKPLDHRNLKEENFASYIANVNSGLRKTQFADVLLLKAKEDIQFAEKSKSLNDLRPPVAPVQPVIEIDRAAEEAAHRREVEERAAAVEASRQQEAKLAQTASTSASQGSDISDSDPDASTSDSDPDAIAREEMEVARVAEAAKAAREARVAEAKAARDAREADIRKKQEEVSQKAAHEMRQQALRKAEAQKAAEEKKRAIAAEQEKIRVEEEAAKERYRKAPSNASDTSSSVTRRKPRQGDTSTREPSSRSTRNPQYRGGSQY